MGYTASKKHKKPKNHLKMITFILCLALLVVAYFTYGKYLDKVFMV